ncbi:MAG: exonuclease SbcCD subunit D [Solirubrobacteraceae bacterium]
MRLVHLSDTHLGWRSLHRVDERGRNQRESDVYEAFDRAIDKTIELAPDVVIHSGDLFDGYHPSSAALKVCLDGIARLRDAGIPFVVIAGNHSTPRIASAEHVFCLLERFDRNGLVHAVFGEPRRVQIGKLTILAVPHVNDEAAVRDTLVTAAPDTDADYNVLVAHLGLDGLGHVGGSEAGSLTLSGETLETADPFDYVALGHLHRFQDVRDNAAYSGSLERLSWADDPDGRKGILEVDLAAGFTSAEFVTLHEIAVRPHTALPTIDASATDDLEAEVIAAAETVDVSGSEPMVRLVVANITSADWSAIDRRRIGAAFESCLHVELVPEIVGEEHITLTPPDLREFLSSWPGAKGIDTEDFIARAEHFLALADQEMSA